MNTILNKIKKRENFNLLILWLIIMMTIVPICFASAYSFYNGDDFDEGVISKFRQNYSLLELLGHSFEYTKDVWYTWMGTYFAKFMQMFLHAFNGGGLLKFRIVMSGNALLFMLSFGLFLYAVSKDEISSRLLRTGVVAIGCIGLLGFEAWPDSFYWFAGAMNYSLPLSLNMLALSLLLLCPKLKKRNMIIIGVLLFCGMGGSLMISGSCCWLLIMVIARLIYKKGFRYQYVCLLIVTMIGCVLNVVAPGNFVRHSVIDDSGVHLFRAIVWSFDDVRKNMQWLTFETPFILLIIFAFWIGVKEGNKQKINEKFAYIRLCFILLTPFIAAYPVCLGYSGLGMVNRCKFILVWALVISIIDIAIIAGKLVAAKTSFKIDRKMVIAGVMLVVIMSVQNEGWLLTSFVPYKTMIALADGKIQEYYRDVNQIYEACAENKNKDVFIDAMPESVDVFSVILLKEDPKWGINMDLTNYYQNRSVHLVLNDVYYGGDMTYIRISPLNFEEDMSYVTIVNSWEEDTQIIQVLEPLNENLVIEAPAEQVGKVGIYAFADSEGQECILQREIEY